MNLGISAVVVASTCGVAGGMAVSVPSHRDGISTARSEEDRIGFLLSTHDGDAGNDARVTAATDTHGLGFDIPHVLRRFFPLHKLTDHIEIEAITPRLAIGQHI